MGVTRGTAAAAALVLLGGILGSVAVAAPARAALTGATATTTTEVVAGATTALTGLGVSAGAADSVFVTVGTTLGRLTVDTGTGIAPAYGYGATGAEVAFSGTGVQVSAALASLALTTDLADLGATADISVMARSAADAVYSPSTGHFYEYVPDADVTWTNANTGAAAHTLGGQAGYLATVPDASVNDLIASRIAGAENVWLGGQAVDLGGNRVWTWEAGPLAGTEFSRCSSTAYSTPCDFIGGGGAYRSWAWGEPNNWDDGSASPGEAYMVTNWQGSYGLWNDLPSVTYGISGYVVEYGDLAYGASTDFTGVYTASSTVTVTGVPSAPTSTEAQETLAATGADVRLFPVALLLGFGVALLAAARGRERRSRA